MALGIIASLKNESVGYIDRSGTTSIRFYRKDFSGANWDRNELMGKSVTFNETTDVHPDGKPNGKQIAKNVRVVE